MKQTFLKTTDADTANKLLLLGFQLMSHEGNVYTFLHQSKKVLNFEEVDKKKIVYTDILDI